MANKYLLTYFLLASPTPVTFLRPRVDGKPVGPWERAWRGDLGRSCNSSSFLKDVMKMVDVYIDPFSDYDKMDAHSNIGETIPFTAGGEVEGGSTWEPE